MVTSTPEAGRAPWGRAPPEGGHAHLLCCQDAAGGPPWAERVHCGLCPNVAYLSAAFTLWNSLVIPWPSWLGPELDCYNRVTGNMDERGAERPETSLSRVNHRELQLPRTFRTILFLWSEETVEVVWGFASYHGLSFQIPFNSPLLLLGICFQIICKGNFGVLNVIQHREESWVLISFSFFLWMLNLCGFQQSCDCGQSPVSEALGGIRLQRLLCVFFNERG